MNNKYNINIYINIIFAFNSNIQFSKAYEKILYT